MVCIRLMRMGTKKRPFYRVVVADSRRFRNGKFIEKLGYYNPITATPDVRLDMDRVDYWLGKGAQASDTVKSLITKYRKAAPVTAPSVTAAAAAPEATPTVS